MTTFLLVRHGLCDPLGHWLAGRAPGVSLNAAGREQASLLGRRLAARAIDALYSSPLERTMETAAAIAEASGLAVMPLDGVVEVDFGEWTGRTFAELAAVPAWYHFNTFRSGTRIPGGELLVEVQARAIAALAALRERHPDGVVAVVTHADVIRAVLVHLLGASLDAMLRLEVDPASVSTIEIRESGARVVHVNEV